MLIPNITESTQNPRGVKVKNMNVVLSIGVALFSFLGSARASISGEFSLSDGITLCTSPNNPLANGLQVLGANRFMNEKVVIIDRSREIVEISADAVHSMHVLNTSMEIPDEVKG